MSDTTTPRKFTVVAMRDSEGPGLLFEYVGGTDEEDHAEADRIMRDPEVKALLGTLIVEEHLGNGLLLHGQTDVYPRPDQAKAGDYVGVQWDGAGRSLPIVQRFVECQEPARDLLGCRECEHVGLPCLLGIPHGKPLVDLTELRPAVGLHSELRDKFKHNRSTLAGYTYVSPVMVTDESEMFVKAEQYPNSIDWGALESRTKSRKAAASTAAENRNFKKQECSKCPAKGPCDAWRHCRGAYPRAEEIQEYVLGTWLPRLKDNPGFTTEQLYAVMRYGGETSDKRVCRRHALLGGLKWDRYKNKFVVRLTAYKRPSDVDLMEINSYDELRKYFPRLPAPGTKHAAFEEPPAELLALYLQAASERQFAAHLISFHGYTRDYVGWVSLDAASVSLGRAGNWGTSTPGSYWSKTIASWADYFDKFRDLPLPKKPVRLGGYY